MIDHSTDPIPMPALGSILWISFISLNSYFATPCDCADLGLYWDSQSSHILIHIMNIQISIRFFRVCHLSSGCDVNRESCHHGLSPGVTEPCLPSIHSVTSTHSTDSGLIPGECRGPACTDHQPVAISWFLVTSANMLMKLCIILPLNSRAGPKFGSFDFMRSCQHLSIFSRPYDPFRAENHLWPTRAQTVRKTMVELMLKL